MKTFSKLIPMTAVVLAIGGAFSTNAMSSNARTTAINIPGFVKANPLGTACNTSVMCSDDIGPLCTVGATQIWGKDASGKCVVELYRNHQ